jgi:hypothetical protein
MDELEDKGGLIFMIYIVTQDGLSNYPVEDDDVIRTIITYIGGVKYNITLERAFNDKQAYINLGEYTDEKTAANVVREIANRRAAYFNIDGWIPCYFMPKEEEEENAEQ